RCAKPRTFCWRDWAIAAPAHREFETIARSQTASEALFPQLRPDNYSSPRQQSTQVRSDGRRGDADHVWPSNEELSRRVDCCRPRLRRPEDSPNQNVFGDAARLEAIVGRI